MILDCCSCCCSCCCWWCWVCFERFGRQAKQPRQRSATRLWSYRLYFGWFGSFLRADGEAKTKTLVVFLGGNGHNGNKEWQRQSFNTVGTKFIWMNCRRLLFFAICHFWELGVQYSTTVTTWEVNKKLWKADQAGLLHPKSRTFFRDRCTLGRFDSVSKTQERWRCIQETPTGLSYESAKRVTMKHSCWVGG